MPFWGAQRNWSNVQNQYAGVHISIKSGILFNILVCVRAEFLKFFVTHYNQLCRYFLKNNTTVIHLEK